MRANASKNAKIGSRQMQKAEELHRAGLLTKEKPGKNPGFNVSTDGELLA